MRGNAELAYASIATLQGLLERREIRSEELVLLHLERAEAHRGINAFISLFSERALDEARAADALRDRKEILGPLHGIPITAKDIVWSKDGRTTSGSKIFASFVPDRDAPCLRRLREAGAILLGKTNLHEFAYGVSSVNPHYGPVRNPWEPSRISGGSSGGSAAALAAGIGYGSIGTDTGGSIRIPSSLCGTVGLKPTYGAVPRDGVTPLSWSLDHVGPMARSVADTALLFELLSGRTLELPTSSEDRPLRGVRVGVQERYFFQNLLSEVEGAVRRAISTLENLGADVVPIDLPEIEIQGACRNTIAFAEASCYHQENLRDRPEDYGQDTRDLLRLGLLIPATDYLTALRARRRIVRAFRKAFEGVGVLAAPSTPSPAPAIGAPFLENGEELRVGLLRLVSPFNTAGFPAVSVPCGFTGDGRPVGLQLAASPGKEAMLLRVGQAYEESQASEAWAKGRWSRIASAEE